MVFGVSLIGVNTITVPDNRIVKIANVIIRLWNRFNPFHHYLSSASYAGIIANIAASIGFKFASLFIGFGR